ncbi:MAG: alanine dehydrogenase [Planctomycetota bacterium]
MIIGIPREIKDNEFRVGMVPVGVERLVQSGHTVLMEAEAGTGCGIDDQEYTAVGAEIVEGHEAIFERSDMIIKVKEPLPEEYPLLKDGQIVFTYFHFAASRQLTEAMLDRRVVAVAYETIEGPDKQLPLLIPMSEVAGRLAVQEGAKYLEKPMTGKGILLGGIPGVQPAKVMVIGGGIVGTQAAKMAAGLGAEVTIMDINLNRLRYLDDIMPANVTTLMSDPHAIRKKLPSTDLVIGAVLIPGAQAPRVVTRDMLPLMGAGSVVVDVAIDQGGCFETSRPTTHSDPVYTVDGVVHYCVANMPGAVARTSTHGLTNATLPYACEIACKGWKKAARESPAIASGLNMIEGKLIHQGVAEAFGMDHTPLNAVLKKLEI